MDDPPLRPLDELPDPPDRTIAERIADEDDDKHHRVKQGIMLNDPAKIAQSLLTDRYQRRVPHLQEIIESIVLQWGGPQSFAKSFFDTFTAAKEGSAVRARMIEKIVDLMKINTQMTGGKEDELDGLDDEQLISFVKETFGTQVPDTGAVSVDDGAGEDSAPADDD